MYTLIMTDFRGGAHFIFQAEKLPLSKDTFMGL